MAKKGRTILFSERETDKNYLTKQLLQRASRTGTAQASKETIDTMGYTVIVENGWLVRKEKDGTITRIKRLEKGTHARKGRIID